MVSFSPRSKRTQDLGADHSDPFRNFNTRKFKLTYYQELRGVDSLHGWRDNERPSDT
jgi:hypothetical protein